jgi:flagellar export protein FliJ
VAKRFQFRLETLRKLRKQRQDECRRVVARRLRQIAAVEGQIDEFHRQLDLHRAALCRLASPPAPDEGKQATTVAASSPGEPAVSVDVTEVRRYRVFVNHLLQSIVDARQRLVELRAELAKEQAVLAEATKAVKVLDKLEERQRRRHDLALARAETAANDEIAAQCARRNALAVAAGPIGGDRS